MALFAATVILGGCGGNLLDRDEEVADDLRSEVALLRARVEQLETKLADVTVSGTDLVFTGVNVHVRSGSGSTDGAANGLGNLIVGYNEGTGSQVRSGSHNLVVGAEHEYTSHGGLVAGYGNTVSGAYASVSGGQMSTASGPFASVSGGVANTASGDSASVGAGRSNTAGGDFASVSGGYGNVASGPCASVSGGNTNTASGESAAVSGGGLNTASGIFASVSGGNGHAAEHQYSHICGGTPAHTTTADLENWP